MRKFRVVKFKIIYKYIIIILKFPTLDFLIHKIEERKFQNSFWSRSLAFFFGTYFEFFKGATLKVHTDEWINKIVSKNQWWGNYSEFSTFYLLHLFPILEHCPGHKRMALECDISRTFAGDYHHLSRPTYVEHGHGSTLWAEYNAKCAISSRNFFLTNA